MELTKNHKDATTRLVKALTLALTEICALEQQSKTFLYDQGDQQGYHNLQRQKAIQLCGLQDELPLEEDLPSHLKILAQEKIGSLAFEAERALRLDSVFYMSVLLFPEDYQDGGENELENLINALKRGCE